MPPSVSFEPLFARLVGVDTTSRNSNLPALEVLAEVLDTAGIHCRIEHTSSDKANLVAVAGANDGDRGRGLVLCGHSDTVPAEEPDWESDPFTLMAHEDRWVGRGSADMKGFLALATELLAAWQDRRLRAPLALLVTHDEEVGSLGAERFAGSETARRLPRSMIIGEPTELEIHRLHKGHLRLTLELTGRTGHSAYPERGVNAVAEAARAVAALERLALELRDELTQDAPLFGEVPYSVLHVASISGGDAINVIPGNCRVEIGLRVLAGVDAEALVERVASTVEAATDSPFELYRGRFSPPMATSADAAVVRALQTAADAGAANGAHFSSDGGFLGDAGFEPVLYGPGSITVAHRANEYLPRADVDSARATLNRVIAELCGDDA